MISLKPSETFQVRSNDCAIVFAAPFLRFRKKLRENILAQFSCRLKLRQSFRMARGVGRHLNALSLAATAFILSSGVCFQVAKLGVIFHCLTTHQAQLDAFAKMGAGGHEIPEDQYSTIVINVLSASEFCIQHGLVDSATKIRLSLHQMRKGRRLDISSMATEIRNIQETIMSETGKIRFLKVASDRYDLIDLKDPFGEYVATAFPSATRDLIEAGNCLGAECSTAAVFHLMRAAEFALRAVARDRGVKFSDKPLEEKEWGQILPNLESKIADLRNAPRSNWTGDSSTKDNQIRFYSGIVQELRGFNDAWRRHVSHADSEAFYDRDAALSVFNHVKLLMQKVSSKISEISTTDIYWLNP